MIGQFKLTRMTVIWPSSRLTRAGKKEGYYRTPDYRIGNRPHTAKFKVVRNVRLFTFYSNDSNLQDEIAGQVGVRKWPFLQIWREKMFRKSSTNRIYEVKYLRYSKTNTTWFISRSSKNYWSLGGGYMRLLPSAYYFPQYHAVFVYNYTHRLGNQKPPTSNTCKCN